MTFVERLIDLRFILGTGTFGETGEDTVNVTGLRVTAKILKAGGPSMGTLDMTVFGLTPSIINQLSTLGLVWTEVRRNTVIVMAYDAGASPAVVFQGTITNAWGGFEEQPEVGFHVEAHTGLIEAVMVAQPISTTGSTKVADIMSSLATTMGLSFENSGVTGVLPISYFWGSPRNQAQAAAKEAGINWTIDNGVLAIWPRGGSRGGLIPVVSDADGKINYPSYTSKGIFVRTLFNPAIGFGQTVQVESSLKPATGPWIVYSLDYNLDAMMPGGKWEVNFSATRPGLGPVVGRP